MLSSADVSRIQYSLSGVRCVSLCMGIHGVSAVLPQHQLLICHNPSGPVNYWHCSVGISVSVLGCDFFSPNTNTQIYKRRFFVSAKEKKVRRDEKPSFAYLFCSKSDFFRWIHRYTLQNDLKIYLWHKLKVTTGTSICAQIEIYEFTNSGRIGG